jgi:glycolate oxidase iron-sulfur subunit
MQTQLADFIRDSHQGQEADAILRSCVHCGFCTATCPTYQLLGDELDGPRGRIYLIKQVLEGQTPSRKTQLHLDRCLTCRSCETTCPSGVRYGRLVDIGRAAVEAAVPRPWDERLARRLLRWLVPSRVRFGLFLGLGQLFRPLLPASLKAKVPPRRVAGPWPTARGRAPCWPSPAAPRRWRPPIPMPPPRGSSIAWASAWSRPRGRVVAGPCRTTWARRRRPWP